MPRRVQYAKYMRFKKDHLPASPGPGRSDIGKALLKPKPPKKGAPPPPRFTGGADEVMDEIEVGEVWVTLRALRTLDGRTVLCERKLHVSCVRDFEEVDASEDEEQQDEPEEGGEDIEQ